MPSLLKIRIGSARNLPVMDRSSELADAYVEIKFADLETQKTEVKRKSLNPVWNEDFRIEVQDDSNLQDAPLEIKVYDHDILSSDDIIGSVYLDLNSLLLEESEGNQSISGWFPIHDTLRGIRGELYVVAKLSFFGDLNPFRESSAGIAFFSVSCTPANWRIEAVCGFVEELVAEEDPEYHWADKIRTTRFSNDARQMLLYNMAGKVRRLLGRKVLDLGGNAVIGYRQHVDLEGQYGVVVRGYGTACVLTKESAGDLSESASAAGLAGLGSPPAATPPRGEGDGDGADGPSDEEAIAPSSALAPRTLSAMSRVKSARRVTVAGVEERHPVPHRARSLLGPGPAGAGPGAADAFAFVTLDAFPPGMLARIGGMVAARAVKLLSSRDREETRDAWWAEVREEVRGHARSLRCPHIVGYRETVTIEDDLIVLSAYGTAAVLDWGGGHAAAEPAAVPPIAEDRPETDPPRRRRGRRGRGRARRREAPCSVCHVPYQRHGAPFPMKLLPCGICGRRIVPEVLLATVEPPALLPVASRGHFVEARVCREKKKQGGESNAIQVSEAIPFLEYDLYSQLMNKLMIHGLNIAFGISLQLVVGQTQIVSVATCTAFYCPALPAPPVLRLSRNFAGSSANEVRLQGLMAGILERSEAHRQAVKREGEALLAARRPAAVAAAVAWNPALALAPRDLLEAALLGSGGWHRRPVGSPSGTPGTRDENEPNASTRHLSFSPNSVSESPAPRPSPRPGAAAAAAAAAGAGVGGGAEGDSPTNTASAPGPKAEDSSSSSSSSESSDEEDASLPGAAIERAQSAGAGSDPRAAFVVEVDDENDAEALSVLLDRQLPPSIRLISTEGEPLAAWDGAGSSTLQLVVAARRVTWSSEADGRHNALFSALFDELYLSLAFKLRQLRPCRVAGLRSRVELPDEDVVQVTLTCMALLECPPQDPLPIADPATLEPSGSTPAAPAASPSLGPRSRGSPPAPPGPPPGPSGSPPAPGTARSGSLASTAGPSRRTTSLKAALARGGQSLISALSGARRASSASASASSSSSEEETPREDLSVSRKWLSRAPRAGQDSTEYIELTSLSWIPGGRVERWLGRLDVHLIRESNEVRDEGGLSQFSHDFLTEANAIARARVAALGGNCLLAYHISQWAIIDNDKWAYTLICVGGDAVHVKYADDRASLGFSRVAVASLGTGGYGRPVSYTG